MKQHGSEIIRCVWLGPNPSEIVDHPVAVLRGGVRTDRGDKIPGAQDLQVELHVRRGSYEKIIRYTRIRQRVCPTILISHRLWVELNTGREKDPVHMIPDRASYLRK